MKKPKGYNGFAFVVPEETYSKEYLETKEGKKEAKKIRKRNKKYQKELKENGFDRTETWSLDFTIASFILPRLKLFRENLAGFPSNLTEKKWEKIIDKMIIAFELYVKDEQDDWYFDEEKTKKVEEGLDLFRKYFMNLWT